MEINSNPISGNTIMDDGQHGPPCIHHQPASYTGRDSIMFGGEDSAPIDAVRQAISNECFNKKMTF